MAEARLGWICQKQPDFTLAGTGAEIWYIPSLNRPEMLAIAAMQFKNAQRVTGNSQCMALLVLDIPSAFDAIDHTTPIDCALTVFGIHDVALE